ncbi:MAG: tRNA (guanine(10)-N(2))-dimethyltransferase [Halobacteriales archaeon]|nr:tRNA (guanine(10)-N(2))-dimethyltransferase [Halobacteriales archaeon]
MERVTEGGACFATEGAFYNPRMEMNRDITVGVLRAWKDEEEVATYLDSNTASGVRGVRAALSGYEATLVDRSEDAVELARRNVHGNGVGDRAEVSHEDANVVMRRNRYDVVDIDPFGSPVPFADSAFDCADSLACFTATDTAPLCGAHDSGVRRYSCIPLNTTYHAEMGLRVLVGALVRTAAKYDVAGTPVLSHSSDHYKRTYLALEEGAKVSNTALEGVGFLSHCFDCGARDVHDAVGAAVPERIERECACGATRRVAGPLWTGALRDAEFVDAVLDELEDESMGTRKRATKTLRAVRDELDTPTHYDHHEVCRRAGVTPSKLDAFVERLRDEGHEATKAHYSGTAFKTDASHDEVVALVGE